MIAAVREQYERYPYPPVPWMALPRRGEGAALRLRGEHEGIRILVAGCGTLEALVVAQAHPRAREVVAMDLSAASLARLRRRFALARARRWALGQLAPRLAPLRLVQGDLHAVPGKTEEPFDYILASNVLHHLPDPATGLLALAHRLKPGGTLRLVTYPAASRVWMRATSRWLRARGLGPETPGLCARARTEIAALPMESPIRSCFESQPETRSQTGLVDAFFHALENPLRPLEWRDACGAAGLRLVAEGQTESSRSTFLDALAPGVRDRLDAWEKLQILDDLLELCANPVLWLAKDRVPSGAAPPRPSIVESSPEEEIRDGLRRAARLLEDKAGIRLQEVLEALRTRVGPRVRADGRPLPGLSVTE